MHENHAAAAAESTARSTGDANAPAKLHRALGFWALTAFGVGDILGAGIYALTGKVAAAAGGFVWVSFLITVTVAMLTALSYAELGSRFPQSGGEASFCQRAIGWPALALFVGYLVFASGTVSLATVSHAFVGYLSAFWGLNKNIPEWIAISLFLAVLSGIAFWGIRQSSAVNIVCTLVEVMGLLFVIGVGCLFLLGDRIPPDVANVDVINVDWSWVGILQGGALAFFAFIGFEDMVNVAEEVKQPEKNIPAAILTALVTAAAVYIAVVLVATSVVPLDVLSQSDAPLLEVVRMAAPAVPEWSFACVALFAVANTGLLNLIMGSRLLYGMAGQGLLPHSLHVVHEKRKSPYRTIGIVFVVGLVLALSGTLTHLAGTTNVLLLLVFFTVNVSLIVLRLREQQPEKTGFRVPIVIAGLGAATCLALIAFLPRASLATASLLIGLGILLVVIWSWRGRGETATSRDGAAP